MTTLHYHKITIVNVMEFLACVASASVRLGSKELQGHKWSSRPIFRTGKIPKIPFLGLSLLPNRTEALATQTTEFFKENILHDILYDKRVFRPSVNNLINSPRSIPWLWCRQFCPDHSSACWLHLLALFSSPEAN